MIPVIVIMCKIVNYYVNYFIIKTMDKVQERFYRWNLYHVRQCSLSGAYLCFQSVIFLYQVHLGQWTKLSIILVQRIKYFHKHLENYLNKDLFPDEATSHISGNLNIYNRRILGSSPTSLFVEYRKDKPKANVLRSRRARKWGVHFIPRRNNRQQIFIWIS
jgi:hypothetical protein